MEGKTFFYIFNQSNPGGQYKGVERLVIEAPTADIANDIAVKQKNVYFDGVDNGVDCDCCGDRWEKVYDENEYKTNLTLLRDVTEYFNCWPSSVCIVFFEKNEKWMFVDSKYPAEMYEYVHLLADTEEDSKTQNVVLYNHYMTNLSELLHQFLDSRKIILDYL